MFCDAQKYPQNILNFVNTKLFAPPKERVVHCFLLNLIVKIVIKCISNVNREMKKNKKYLFFLTKMLYFDTIPQLFKKGRNLVIKVRTLEWNFHAL